MDKKHLKWLCGELPDLVERGIMPANTAERIRQHYGADEDGSGRRTALTVCSILGAFLIGSGIILLLAHNWEGLSRPVRTVLALTPLVVAQGLGAFILWKGKESTAWRESVGIAITLALAASIALVGQTYHIPGNLGSFLLTWTLLTLPALTPPCSYRSTATTCPRTRHRRRNPPTGTIAAAPTGQRTSPFASSMALPYWKNSISTTFPSRST